MEQKRMRCEITMEAEGAGGEVELYEVDAETLINYKKK